MHAKRELSDCAKSLSLELLREYDGHISGKMLLFVEHELLENIYTNSPLSGLHCASLFGIVEVVASLIDGMLRYQRRRLSGVYTTCMGCP